MRRMEEDMLVVKQEVDQYNDAIGIPKGRAIELTDEMTQFVIREKRISRVFDRIWNNVDYTFEEKVFLTFKMGTLIGNPEMLARVTVYYKRKGEI